MKLIGMIALAAGGAGWADVVALNPSADVFVAAAHPANNYGGGGSLAVAAAGLPNGEFQSLLRFETSAAAAAFDSSFGPGRWMVVSVTLRLNATPPANPIFNPAGAGQFGVSWMRRDDWEEGSGTPNMPGTSGLVFASLPSYLDPQDEPLGVFWFDGSTSGAVTRSLALTAGLVADVRSGGAVTLRAHPVGATVAYLFNSRSFQTVANRPVLEIEAGPSCYANCDRSTAAPVLNVADFGCFLNSFASGASYANCDGSSTPPTLNIADFSCFLNAFAAGCS